ncbi:MAG: hypothetical protein NTY19_26730 [Planctomycetota bacterium]|nr:hypothetical protein [Planctomycetota bacterium]
MTQGGCLVRVVMMIGMMCIGIRVAQKLALGGVATPLLAILFLLVAPIAEFLVAIVLDWLHPTTKSANGKPKSR